MKGTGRHDFECNDPVLDKFHVFTLGEAGGGKWGHHESRKEDINIEEGHVEEGRGTER